MNAWLSACALAIAVVAGLNLVRTVSRLPAPSHAAQPRSTDVVIRQEERFRGVAAALRARDVRGPVGYLTDVGPTELARDGQAMQDYFLTQFVVAPSVLEADFGHCTWAIGNFKSGSGERVPAAFEIVENFGAGVVLLRRRP